MAIIVPLPRKAAFLTKFHLMLQCKRLYYLKSDHFFLSLSLLFVFFFRSDEISALFGKLSYFSFSPFYFVCSTTFPFSPSPSPFLGLIRVMADPTLPISNGHQGGGGGGESKRVKTLRLVSLFVSFLVALSAGEFVWGNGELGINQRDARPMFSSHA